MALLRRARVPAVLVHRDRRGDAPFYVIRAFGGLLFLIGALVMVYNLWRTVRGEIRAEEPLVRAPAAAPAE